MSDGTGVPAQGEARARVTERINVGLIAKATRDLRRTQVRAGPSHADLINRAITLYEFIDEKAATPPRLPDRGPPKLVRMPADSAPATTIQGHIFISYVRQDSARVDRLQEALSDRAVRVWRDTADLWPGEDWQAKIRHAISSDTLVFLACFSRNSLARTVSYQNEELLLAIEQLRRRRPGEPWLIPVRLDDCDIPELDIGGGRTLASIQRADLFGAKFDENMTRLIAAIFRILETTRDSPRNP